VIEGLTIQLKAAGATWGTMSSSAGSSPSTSMRCKKALREVKRPENSAHPPTSTMIGVTRLSHPDFLIEVDLIAITNA
jgi:enamine deaminase RidA (YjgF/YER057c/UK114 family)